MSDQIHKLEESVAHLVRVVDEISDVVARQEDEITRLKRRQNLLVEREAEREAADGGSVQLGDQPPPHW